MQTKKELLATIEQLELERLNNLTREELVNEYYDWFVESDFLEDVEADSSHNLIVGLMNSYMSYRYDESEEELLEHLKGISGAPLDENVTHDRARDERTIDELIK